MKITKVQLFPYVAGHWRVAAISARTISVKNEHNSF